MHTSFWRMIQHCTASDQLLQRVVFLSLLEEGCDIHFYASSVRVLLLLNVINVLRKFFG